MKKLLATSLVAAALAAALPAVHAQSTDAAAAAPVADPAGAPARQFGPRHHEQRAFRAPSERVEARLAYLRTALKITDAQQPQWDAYAGFLRKQAATMEQRFKERRAQMEKAPGERKRPTVVERQERQRAHLAEATQRLDARLAVVKPLYAALSPEQQRVADEVLAPRGRGGPGGRGRGQHHGGFGRG